MKSNYCILLLTLIISACTQIPKKSDAIVQTSRWLKHKTYVERVSDWHIYGRIGINSVQQNGSASLSWRQTGDNYELRIIAPLGQGAYLFKGSPSGVQMRGHDNLLLRADTLEELMLKNLGWSVNLSGLRYWVRGLPQPTAPFAQLELDDDGRLNYLEQSGYSVKIQRYANVQHIDLPKKLVIKNNGLRLKILITDWEFSGTH